MSEPVPPSREVVSSVLSFYSSQLTSHASMIVGFIVAFFTLVQTRQSILGLGVPPWGFEFFAFAILSAVTYSMLRLVLYGSLSGVLMHAPMGLYEEFLRTRSIREFDHASVNEFASYSLVRYTRPRGFLYKARVYDSRKAKRKVSYIFQLPMILSFVLASFVHDCYVWSFVRVVWWSCRRIGCSGFFGETFGSLSSPNPLIPSQKVGCVDPTEILKSLKLEEFLCQSKEGDVMQRSKTIRFVGRVERLIG